DKPQEWNPPAPIAVVAVRPLTTTGVGVGETVVVPFPNSPKVFRPQHRAVPFASTAHEWYWPALIAVAVVRPLTATGVDALVVVPFPNSPLPLLPQHLALPFANTAHEWYWPVLRVTAVVRRCTTTGVDVGEAVVVPFPS